MKVFESLFVNNEDQMQIFFVNIGVYIFSAWNQLNVALVTRYCVIFSSRQMYREL